MRSWRTGAGSALSLAVLLPLLAAAPVRAQQIQGIVLDEFSHAPVKAADVELLGPKGRILGRERTGPDGRFEIRIPRFDVYAVKVVALGYAPFTTRVFSADTSQQVLAQVNLAPAPLALQGLNVTTTAIRQELEKAGFYRREKAGFGYFLTAKQVEEKAIDRITDAFYGIPGIQVLTGEDGGPGDIVVRGAPKYCAPGGSGSSSGSGHGSSSGTGCVMKTCYPSVYVDGDLVRRGGSSTLPLAGGGAVSTAGWWTELVSPANVAAIEVYTHPGGLPAFALGTDSPCGAVIIWTKEH